MTYDLAIEGGEVVTPQFRRRLNVYVAGDKIAAVTPDAQPARETVDASGLLVMPGMVDTHVHFMDPGDTSREDFPTGTAAAAGAGVTSVIEHTHAAPVISADDLADKRSYLGARSRVDFALAAHAWPDRLEDVAGVWRAGAAFIKAFTCTTHGVPGFDPAHLHALFAEIAREEAICLAHCEDESLTSEAERTLHAAGRTDGSVIPAWRNPEAELSALAVARVLADATGARVVAAHVSHTAALETARGLVVETCPQYLTLLEDEVLEHGAFRKFTPPARARSAADLEAMWQALRDGAVDYVSSDHAPSTGEQKRAGSIWAVHFGLPGVDTTLPILLNGAHAGRISYERLVSLYSEMPARIYGLWPDKGRLEPGADADLVLVDPSARWTITDDAILSKAGWSPFAGQRIVGRAVRTYARGTLAAVDGNVVAEPGAGRFLPGRGAQEAI
ncbi:MAG TPA: dihydroorotase family protein [Gaiellaceae bacterium]|nr:dihydroorotase family protein [Gaiellaceae bacterium]